MVELWFTTWQNCGFCSHGRRLLPSDWVAARSLSCFHPYGLNQSPQKICPRTMKLLPILTASYCSSPELRYLYIVVFSFVFLDEFSKSNMSAWMFFYLSVQNSSNEALIWSFQLAFSLRHISLNEGGDPLLLKILLVKRIAQTLRTADEIFANYYRTTSTISSKIPFYVVNFNDCLLINSLRYSPPHLLCQGSTFRQDGKHSIIDDILPFSIFSRNFFQQI